MFESGIKIECILKYKLVIDYINIFVNMICIKICYLVVVVY